jgi:uncharacterized membrane protein
MNFIRFLKRELSVEAQDWVNDGLISREQGEKILSRYGTNLPDGSQRKIGYYVLLSIASLLIGLAIIVIMGENWEEIPRVIRMMGMFVAVISFNGLGLYHFRKGNEGAASSIFLCGSMTYGAAIFLIAQIYHIEAHYPNGVFYWALGVLPFALLLKSKSILLLAQVLSAIWAFLEFEIGYFPSFYLLFVGSFFYFVFKLKKSTPMFLISFALSITFIEFALSHYYFPNRYYIKWGSVHVFYSVSTLIITYLIAKVFENESYKHYVRDYAMAVRLWALRLGIIFFFVFSFSEPWKALIKSAAPNPIFSFFNGIIVLLLMFGAYWKISKQAKIEIIHTLKKDLLLVSIGLMYCFFCLTVSLLSKNSSPIYLQVLTNLMLFLTGIKILINGLRTMRGISFYTGLSIILVQVFCRYIDLIGNYIGGAALFLIAGLIMILAARFWKNHGSQQIQGAVA